MIISWHFINKVSIFVIILQTSQKVVVILLGISQLGQNVSQKKCCKWSKTKFAITIFFVCFYRKKVLTNITQLKKRYLSWVQARVQYRETLNVFWRLPNWSWLIRHSPNIEKWLWKSEFRYIWPSIPNQAKYLEPVYGHFHRPLALFTHR